MTPSPPLARRTRAIGLGGLLALALNGVIGSAIFALPAQVAGLFGAAAPVSYFGVALVTLAIVLCFAELGSRFERDGGPYLYAREAFGPFIGFQTGWVFALSRLASVAAISHASAAYAGHLLPWLATPLGRGLYISLTLLALTGLNVLGVRQGALAVVLLAIGKLLPLGLFVAVGLCSAPAAQPSPAVLPSPSGAVDAALLLVFAFGGFETASIPTEEMVSPRRHLPVALVASLLLTTGVYASIQFVAQRAVPDIARSPAPLATAAEALLGAPGALLIGLGAVISTLGTTSGNLLVAPRLLHALASHGQLPAVLARLHPRFHTPHVAVALFAACAWALSLSSNFGALAAASSVGRLMVFGTSCAAVLALRRESASDARRVFTVPGGAAVPVLGTSLCLLLLAGCSRTQLLATATVVGTGALLHAVARAMAARSAARQVRTGPQ
ncbi:APC family permease [Cystobacter fuscus]|nr:amino acid permease [Cystobacter fuscus]